MLSGVYLLKKHKLVFGAKIDVYSRQNPILSIYLVNHEINSTRNIVYLKWSSMFSNKCIYTGVVHLTILLFYNSVEKPNWDSHSTMRVSIRIYHTVHWREKPYYDYDNLLLRVCFYRKNQFTSIKQPIWSIKNQCYDHMAWLLSSLRRKNAK